MLNWKRIFTYTFTILILIAGCAFWFFAPHFNDDWKNRTTPLTSNKINTLCSNFGLENDDSLCNNTKDVYGPDFYDIILETFRPSEDYRAQDGQPAVYDEVEKMIGTFKTECEPVVEEQTGFKYFICHYDLRGDQVYIIGVFYEYTSMEIFRIVTPMGED